MKYKALLLMACAAALALPAAMQPADAFLEVHAACDSDRHINIVWTGKPNTTDHVKVLVKAPDNPTFYIASTNDEGSTVGTMYVSKQAELGVEYVVKVTTVSDNTVTGGGPVQTTITCTTPLPFTASYSCSDDSRATVSWENPPLGAALYILRTTVNDGPGTPASTDRTSITTPITYGSTYGMTIQAYARDNIPLDDTSVTFTCTDPANQIPNTPPPATPDTTTPDTTTPDQTTRTTGGGGAAERAPAHSS